MRYEHLVKSIITAALLVSGYSSGAVIGGPSEPGPSGRDLPAPANSPPLREPMGVLNLPQALSLTILRSPELAVYSFEARAREAEVLQAGLRPNPLFELESENVGGTGPLRGFSGAETTFWFSQPFLLGGKRSKRREVAVAERDLAGWDYESKRLDVLTATSLAFADVLAAQEQVALSAELIGLAERFRDTVAERVQAGKVAQLELTRAEVALATSRIELNKARGRLTVARKFLAAAWGSDKPTFERVVGDLEQLSPVPPADSLAGLLARNPDLARWSDEINARRAVLRLAGAEAVPDLELVGAPRRFNESGGKAFALGLSVSLPVFNRNQGGRRAAQHRLEGAERLEEAIRLRFESAFAATYTDLATASGEALTLKESVLPGARSAFEVSSEGYRQGKFGYLDVLDAQRTLFEVRGRYIETLRLYHRAAADMERLIGRRLNEINTTPEE